MTRGKQEEKSCDYCELTDAEMSLLNRPPVARCGSCKYKKRVVSREHFTKGHHDYQRFYCRHCR